MIDARAQIKDALLTVCNNVKMTKPDGDVELPLVCYGLISNIPENKAYSQIRWRVTCYCNSMEALIDLCKDVDDVMSTLGYTLKGETPDEEARKGVDFYMKRLTYGAIVDLIHMAVLENT